MPNYKILLLLLLLLLLLKVNDKNIIIIIISIIHVATEPAQVIRYSIFSFGTRLVVCS
jgi:hypothetical protein